MLTGFRDLDSLTGGGTSGELVFLGGSTASGKTAFAHNVALHQARHGKAVAIFSLEMTETQVTHRLISALTSIPVWKVASGGLASTDWRNLYRSIYSLLHTQLFIDDSPRITIDEMRERLWRLSTKRKRAGESPLSLVVVDYIQLMVPALRDPEDHRRHIAFAIRRLKRIALDFGVTVLVLGQLDRASDGRRDKSFLLSDLGELELVEQDADIVMFLHHKECYNPNSDGKGIAEVIVAKQRFGSTGRVQLAWYQNCGRWQILYSDPPPDLLQEIDD